MSVSSNSSPRCLLILVSPGRSQKGRSERRTTVSDMNRAWHKSFSFSSSVRHRCCRLHCLCLRRAQRQYRSPYVFMDPARPRVGQCPASRVPAGVESAYGSRRGKFRRGVFIPSRLRRNKLRLPEEIQLLQQVRASVRIVPR